MALSLVSCLQTAVLGFNSQPASAQEFFDCESRPGEYIIKFKEDISAASGSPTAVKALINSQLEASQVKEYAEVSPLLESVKSAKSKEEIKQLLQKPEFASKVEYVHANCLLEKSDRRVSGTLRDPAGEGSKYNFTAVGSTVDRDTTQTAAFSVSEAQGHRAWDTGYVLPVSDDVYRYYPLRDAITFPAHFRQSIDSGMEPLLTFGVQAIPTGTNTSVDLAMIKVSPNQGNGRFKPVQDYLILQEGDGLKLRAAKEAVVDADILPDFVAALEDKAGKAVIKVIKSSMGEYKIEDIPLTQSAHALSVGHFNRDTNVDIAAFHPATGGAGAKSSVSFYAGSKDGFSKRTQIDLPDSSFNKGFKVEDRDGDGLSDIVAISGSELAIASGSGEFKFQPFKRYDMSGLFGEGTQLQLSGVEVVDVDKNGSNDVIFMGVYQGSTNPKPISAVVVLLSFGAENYIIGLGVGEHKSDGLADRLTVRDVNGDERPDLLVSSPENNQLRVYVNEPGSDGSAPISFQPEDSLSIPLGASPLGATATDPFALSGMIVAMKSAAGQAYYALTDKQGKFEFSNLPDGVYTSEVWGDSYFFPDFDGKQIKVDRDIDGLTPYAKRKPLTPPDSPANKAPNTPNDYGFNHLWGLHNYGQNNGVVNVDVDAPESWSVSRGQGVVVAVFDTGLEVTHPEIEPNRWRNEREIPDNKIDDDKNGVIDDAYGLGATNLDSNLYDEGGHGTHVAGTIGAAGNNGDGVIGVAPQSKLLGIDISDDSGVMTMQAVLNGVQYILWAKRNGHNVRVANASFGAPVACDKMWVDVLGALQSEGILLVASAGNDGQDNDTVGHSPAGCNAPNLIAVANINNHGELDRSSNYGKATTHVAAPGTDVWSTSTERGYAMLSGTSMAAPHVSGVAALLFAANPSMTPEQVKARLIQTSKKVSGLEGKVSSGGVVSAAAALAGSSSGGGNTGGGNTGGGNTGGGSTGGGSTGGITGGNSDVGVSFSISNVVAKKTTPVRMTFSQNLTPGSVGCFQGAVSPRKKNQSVRATLKGNQIALQLVQKSGKKLKPVAWPAAGKLAIKIAGNCATGASGVLVDSDSDGKAGGASRVINLTIGAANTKKK
jgi:subtilisin family serine protease